MTEPKLTWATWRAWIFSRPPAVDAQDSCAQADLPKEAVPATSERRRYREAEITRSAHPPPQFMKPTLASARRDCLDYPKVREDSIWVSHVADQLHADLLFVLLLLDRKPKPKNKKRRSKR